MVDSATICAIATPPGSGAISVIRVSGKETFKICQKLIRFNDRSKKSIRDLPGNTIHHASFENNGILIDDVLVSIFVSPLSYTGEDVIEISCHGAHYIQQQILELLIKNGARLARPGEFTQRAFLNGKMDLSQAEAVADLIASESSAHHKIAINQIRGGFSNEIANLREQLLHFISLIELELDFSEEDVEFADRKAMLELINAIHIHIKELVHSFGLGNVIRKGVPVAITGKTNVGKSTLLNALLHEEKAIVSEIAGTTRDIIEDVISIEGFSFRFIDTAGLRLSSDTIENIGIQKAFEKIKQAYIVLYVIDATQKIGEIDRLAAKIKTRIHDMDKKLIFVLNKIDGLSDEELSDIKNLKNFKNLTSRDKILFISAYYNENIDHLASLLVAQVKQKDSAEQPVIVTNTRHFEALSRALDATERVQEGLKTNITSDFLAMDIREVLHYLGEITGEVTTDEILGNIFSKFCIGK